MDINDDFLFGGGGAAVDTACMMVVECLVIELGSGAKGMIR